MLEITPSALADWPACKALWRAAFGDGDEYIDNFHKNYYQPERMLVLKEEGVVRAMLALLPGELRWPDGGLTRSAYLYALATDPAFRGQGFAGFLLRGADAYLERQGVPFLSTVPAEESLQRLFAAGDFQPCHPIDEAQMACPGPGPVPARQVRGEEYYQLREMLLEGTAHTVYDAAYLDYQAQVSALARGGLYRMDTPGGPACAVAEVWGERLDVRELLAPAGQQAVALAALAAALPGQTTCRVRCPAGRGELPGTTRRIFGMGKRVPPTSKTLGESYFGLAFD